MKIRREENSRTSHRVFSRAIISPLQVLELDTLTRARMSIDIHARTNKMISSLAVHNQLSSWNDQRFKVLELLLLLLLFNKKEKIC